MDSLDQELDRRDVRAHNVEAITAVTDIIQSTLGPLGMNKLLIDANGNVVITNNGGTVLQELAIEEPIANIVLKVSNQQIKQCGDGTTTATILTSQLLTVALSLLEDGVHPRTIADGFSDASREIKKKLVSTAVPIDVTDSGPLLKVARNALNGRGTGLLSERRLATVSMEAVEGVTTDGRVDLNAIKIDKIVGATGLATRVHNGALVSTDSACLPMATSLSDATILTVDDSLTTPTENRADGWTISVSSMEQCARFETASANRAAATAERVHQLGVDAIFHTKASDDELVQQLADRNILVAKVSGPKLRFIKKVVESGMMPDLERATPVEFGHGDIRYDETESWLEISGSEHPGVTVSIRGSVEPMIDELHSSITDATDAVGAAVDDGHVLPGGGATEAALAAHLRTCATGISDKRQLVLEEYANALEKIPRQLARSAGMDEIDVITELRVKHASGDKYHGVDLTDRTISDMLERDIVDTVSVKATAIDLATEASTMVTRVDGMVPTAGSQINASIGDER